MSGTLVEVASNRDIPFLYGLRGVLAIYVMLFHLNYILLAALPFAPPLAYRPVSNFLRYGDFRVAIFFVISGYLLAMPISQRVDWNLPYGTRAFLQRRAERLLWPYYIAFAFSCVLFVAWLYVTGHTLDSRAMVHAIVTHVLLVHNLLPNDMLLVNDALWNVALEVQVYVLFAFVLVPSLRRFGPWLPVFVITIASLVPHFFFHGFLDWVRPWFVALFTLGVAVTAISNRTHPELQKYERRVPWGWVWLVSSALVPFAIWASGIDTSYGAGWLQALLVGIAAAAFLVFVRIGMPGSAGGAARACVAVLEIMPLRRLGIFSYSIYLIHYPVLRLLCGITARYTQSFWILGALAVFVYVPLTVGLAYLFHLGFERPFQMKRSNPAAQELAAEIRASFA